MGRGRSLWSLGLWSLVFGSWKSNSGESMRVLIAFAVASCLLVPCLLAQQPPRVYTIQELFTRNVGTTEQQNKQFPPHKIIGNVYYVGTETLGTFLVTTPQGHILINTDYERNNAV